MWTDRNSGENYPRTGFYTPPLTLKSGNSSIISQPWMSEKRQRFSPTTNPDLYHVLPKVPHGNSPYVNAKRVQMIEKDPGKAVSMFWNAINSGDRVDSALKDMAAVMKQLNRPDEAIEAIRSFRHLCPPDSQESIDNILVELYKKSGRLEEEIEVLRSKLKRVESSFGRKSLRMRRSHGKRVPVQPQQEYARLLGNLAWAYLQLNEYKTAEDYYRKALSIEPDRNKQCNLAICLMFMNNITEAKFLLQSIQASTPEGKMDESYAKAYGRASELLVEIESQSSEDNKENHSANAQFFAFTPYKTPKRSKDPFVWSPISQPKRTPLIPSGKPLVSPFTQPRIDSRRSDSDNWRKGNQVNESVSHFPRRLHFENATDPKRSMTLLVRSTESTPKEHFTETNSVENELNFGSFKSKKSWADMVDEEDEEQQFSARRSLDFQQQEKKRLDVFSDFAPRTPKA